MPCILNYVVFPLCSMLLEDTIMRRMFILSSLLLCLPVGSALAKVDAEDVATSALSLIHI